MNFIKFLITKAVVLIFLCSSNTYAQENRTEISDPIQKSMWAFQASDHNTAVTLQLKYHTSNRTAMRYGVVIDIGGSNSKGSYYRMPVDTITGRSKSDFDNRTISNRFEFLYYPFVTEHFAFYSGFGPEAGFGRMNGYGKSEEPDYSRKNRTRARSRHFALNILAGIEWFPFKKVSVLAEYEIFGRVQSERITYSGEGTAVWDDETWGYKDSYKSRGYRLGSNGMKLGVSVYW